MATVQLLSRLSLCILLLTGIFCLPGIANAQQYDVLIKEGHVIDPKNQLNAVMDVAISKGVIARVAKDIPASQSVKVIHAKGLYVVPGLIDLHTHVFVGSNANAFANGVNSVSPDDFTLRSGVTTVVDAGTSGWKSFPLFKSQVIDQSKTRILAFLNITGAGMIGSPGEEDLQDMDVQMTSKTIKDNPDVIVGVKIGHIKGKEWTPFDRALEAAGLSGTPLFVECHLPEFSLEDQLKRMRPGDMITHTFEHVSERMPVVGDDGKVRPFVLAAQKRGVLFDLGHGGAGFWFDQAVPAYKQGFFPDSFGTDLHRFSMNAGMKDMMYVMSKFYNMGMKLEDIILRGTWNAARSIKRQDLGNLSEGATADLAILGIREGEFGFLDSGGNSISGKHKLEAEMTIRQGKIVWDLNGLGAVKRSH